MCWCGGLTRLEKKECSDSDGEKAKVDGFFLSIYSSIYEGREPFRDEEDEDVIWIFGQFQRDTIVRKTDLVLRGVD